MMLIVVDEAEKEFHESINHYESNEAGLGQRFRNEVATALDWIEANPEVPASLTFAPGSQRTRHQLHQPRAEAAGG